MMSARRDVLSEQPGGLVAAADVDLSLSVDRADARGRWRR